MCDWLLLITSILYTLYYTCQVGKLVNCIWAGGILIYNKDDKNIGKLDFENEPFKKIGFSKEDKEFGEIRKILQVPGLHNALNALAAFRAARALGLGGKEILSTLSEYRGAWRSTRKPPQHNQRDDQDVQSESI